MLAKDGHCKTFDADADGYVRSEGCGVIVLKRLSDAVRDNDPILGVIRATTINQDGASSGLNPVPNGESQASLIRSALNYAKLNPSDIDYIEAHGTGTALGDPIEVGALGEVFKGRQEQPLILGTVKTNMGHLESAAGIAGVIKTLLALNNEAIPPHLHFKHLNPHISLDSIPAKIPLILTPWKRSNRPRIAGVSSFGFSGTNAHVILEEPPILKYEENVVDRPCHLLTLSAKTQKALDQLIDLYRKNLPDSDIADIAFTANTGRAHFHYRMSVVAKTKEELLNHLQKGNYLIDEVPLKVPKVVFLFTGQTQKSTELLETSPIFKEAMERSHGLYEYALFELWKSWGVVPNYVAGEGIGDIIAAIAAEIITLEEGLKLIAASNNPKDLLQVSKQIIYREPQIGFISSWTGDLIRKESLTADYWKIHETIRNIPEDTLTIRPQNHWNELLHTLSQLYLKGVPVNWKSFDKPYSRKKVPLPTYPFQRERFWADAIKTKKARHLSREAHPLLGELIQSPSEEKLFRNELDLDFVPYLADHQVFDSILFPGAGFAEIFHAAGNKLFNNQFFMINNLVIEQPLPLDTKKETLLELLIKPKEGGYTASIYSIEEGNWIRHSTSELSVLESSPTLNLDWEHLCTICQKPIDIENLYKNYDATGLHYGEKFKTLQNIQIGNNEFTSELEGEASAALLDGCLQALGSLIQKEGEHSSTYLPLSIDRLICFAELGTSIRIHGKVTELTDNDVTAEFSIFSFDGEQLMRIEGYHARKTDQAHLQQMLAKQTGLSALSWFYQITWQPKPLENNERELTGSWLIVSEEKEEIEGLQARHVKPEGVISEIGEKLPEGIIWFASGKNSLKYAFECVQVISKLETKPRLFFITRGIQPIGSITDLESAPFNGFFKTLKLELPSFACRHIDLGAHDKFPMKELLSADDEDQVAYYEGIRYVPRLFSARDAKHSGKKLLCPIASAFQLETTSKGSLENLYLRPRDAISSPGPNDVTIEVMAAGLNFRDVLNAMGLYPGDPGPLGGECAGVITAVGKNITDLKVGDPVVGFAPGCFAWHITASKELFTLNTTNLTFSQAAAISIVFSTAYYALITLAKLKAGEKVLIHAAAGGVGLAAIQIAQPSWG